MAETPSPDGTPGAAPFDRRALRLHRGRAAAGVGAHDFLHREVAERLADRLADVARRFPVALDLGCHGGALGRALAGRGGVETLVRADPALGMARRAGRPAVVAEEDFLPFRDGAFDLVLTALALHWVNDLPGALIQIGRVLKPDGLFLGAMLGGDTLVELRHALIEAEIETAGGAGPRVAPFAELADAAGLLQRAGFALPVADTERITVNYPDPFALMRELRGMGEANALAARRRRPTRRATLLRAAEIYQARHADDAGRIPATFELLFLTGWRPADSQPRPLRPGSAETRLADALGAEERPAGEKAGPT